MARWTTIKYFFRLLFVKNIQNDNWKKELMIRTTIKSFFRLLLFLKNKFEMGKKELMIRTTIKSFFRLLLFLKNNRNRKKGINDMNNHTIFF